MCAEKNTQSFSRQNDLKSDLILKQILDGSPFPIAVVDVNDEQIDYWSQSAKNLFGHTPNNTTEWYRLAYPDPQYRKEVIERWKPFLKKAMKSNHAINTGEYQITCHDGSIKICELYLQYIPDHLIVTFNNVSEHNKVESALIKEKERAEKSEKNLKKSQELAHIGSWYLDVETNEVTWTEELYKMYGFDPSLPPPPYTEHMKLFTPESWDLLSVSLEKTQKTGIPYELELKTVKSDGSNGWMWVRGEAIKDGKGKTTGLWGAAQDITVKKQAEAKIKESENRFRSMFENHSAVMLLIDPSTGNILNSNHSASKFYGYSRKELSTLSIDDINTLKPEILEEKRRQALANEVNLFKFKHRLKNNTVRDVEVHSSPIEYGDQKLLFSIIYDITERIKATNHMTFLNNSINDLISIDDTKSLYDYFTQSIHSFYPNAIILYMSADEEKKFVKLESLAGLDNSLLAKIIKNTGFDPIGNHFQLTEEHKKIFSVGRFHAHEGGLADLPANEYPIAATKIIQKLLNIHRIYSIGINKDNELLGGMHIFTLDGKEIKDGDFLETYTAYFSSIIQNHNVTNKLKLSESRLRDAQRIAHIGNWTLDLKTGKVDMSDEMLDLVGFKDKNKAKDVSNHEIFYTADSWQRYNKALNKALKTGESYELEMEFSDKNTKYRYAIARGELAYDDNSNIIALKGTLQDITERKKAEKQLKESQIQLKNIVENSTNLFYSHTTDHKLTFVSPQVREYLGCGPEEAMRRWTDFVTDNPINEEGFKFTEKAIMTGQRQPTYELELKRKDGSKIMVEVREAPLVQDGKVKGIVGSLVDISERKKAEEELIKAKEKAEESDKLKSAFLANMSHEIRTPMNGIIGFSSLLQKPDLSDQTRSKYIQIIQKSGERMLSTINDLIDISKIETGQEELYLEAAEPDKLLCNLYDFFKRSAEDKGLDLTLEQDPVLEETIANMDISKFNSIVTNLIRNAIKYTAEGYVHVQAEKEEENLIIRVSDSGQGIPIDRQEAIFDRFVQADLKDKQVFEGSGLGLSIVKAYVEMMDGNISLDSAPGKGSCFTVRLPILVPEKSNTEKKAEVEETAVPKFKKILIAEDDDISYTHLSISLQSHADDILHAVDGKQAVKMAKENPDLDLILMDIKMPVMDGYEATKTIREFNKDVMIIAQTAYALPEDRDKAKAVGCNDYISKPIDISNLLSMISSETA